MMEWIAILIIAWILWHFIGRHAVASARQKEVKDRENQKTTDEYDPENFNTNTTETNRNNSSDEFEGSFYEVQAQRSIRKTVQIRYVDVKNLVTDRVFDIRAWEPAGDYGLVLGRCHLRNANRTLRFDRMDRVIDQETGEIIPDLQKYLNDEWEASPAPVLDLLFSAQRIKVLKEVHHE